MSCVMEDIGRLQKLREKRETVRFVVFVLRRSLFDVDNACAFSGLSNFQTIRV